MTLEFFSQVSFCQFAWFKRKLFWDHITVFMTSFIYWYCFMTNMSQFQTRWIRSVSCSRLVFSMKQTFQRTFQSERMRGNQWPDSPIAETSGSSQQPKTQCLNLDFNTNIVHTPQYPFLQDKHTCDSSLKATLVQYIAIIHFHVNFIRKNSKRSKTSGPKITMHP